LKHKIHKKGPAFNRTRSQGGGIYFVGVQSCANGNATPIFVFNDGEVKAAARSKKGMASGG
jgi:hypothetical protein